MPRFLPLFPLELVVYPGERLNLHIFEPRYKQLVHDCLADSRTFGIPVFLNKRVAEFGTEMRLVAVEKTYEDGKMDVRTEGMGVFRLLEFLKEVPDKAYSAAVIKDIRTVMDHETKVASVLFGYLTQLYQLLGLGEHGYKQPADIVSFDIAHKVGMDIKDEYQLLLYTKETDRQKFLVNHLKNTLPVLMRTEQLKERIRMNGHFRQLKPPKF